VALEYRGTVSAYAGTAGEMLDFSPAAGLEPIRSSFSSSDFSEMILRVAIAGCVCFGGNVRGGIGGLSSILVLAWNGGVATLMFNSRSTDGQGDNKK